MVGPKSRFLSLHPERFHVTDQNKSGKRLWPIHVGGLKKTKSPRRNFDIHSGKMRGRTVLSCHQNNGGAVEAGAPSVEKDYASSIEVATEVPPSSFEFYVWSDMGINLQVDLTLSPLDWINKFRNEVCISKNMHRNKSRSLWQDLSGLGENYTQGKSSFLWSTNCGKNEEHDGQARSSSSLKLTKDDATELAQQKKDDIALICDSLTPCSMSIEVKDNLQGNHSTVSAELNVNLVDSLMQDQSTVSAEVSCAKDASKKIIDLDATNMPFIKSLCDSVVNSLSDPGMPEHQHSKPDNECSEDCSGACFVDPDVVCAGASLGSSVGLQNSEVISCHKYASASLCDNDGSLHLSDPKSTSDMEQGRLVKTRINFETDSNNFTSLTDEWEVGKIVDGRESSECSQFDDPPNNSSIDYSNQDCKLELHKKRKNRDSEIQCSNGTPTATTTRVLRSTKYGTTRVLRSMKNTAVKLPR